eukprot:CAMPEP_0181042574 /NCGR_PEP_ID=MMETSP1070-20121207/12225_1 /TAXON_ID=265543 /ORGANISM="Minutocellus polymorphus, Strain NH13" /LENGTH=314 /DNA_ID=CAMNT_0023120801 /DNA_START=98 /DNA_END=1042 /DNA_ORIENTATION=-
MASAIGARAARSALAYRRQALVPDNLTAVARSMPAQLATRYISTPSAPSFRAAAAAAARPEDRLKAARRKARAALGLPDDDDGDIGGPAIVARDAPVAEWRSSVELQAAVASAKPHPEDRLKAARRKMLESMGLTVDGDGNVVQPREATPTVTAVDATDADTNGPLPICAQNNHPDYRLRLARERMLAKVKGDNGVDVGVDAVRIPARSLSPTRIDLDLSPDRRLHLARTEQAAKPLQTFVPIKRKKRRPKPGVLLSRLSSEQPPLLRNDGYSSGAVASIRLREARQDVMERLSSSSSSSSLSPPPKEEQQDAR